MTGPSSSKSSIHSQGWFIRHLGSRHASSFRHVQLCRACSISKSQILMLHACMHKQLQRRSSLQANLANNVYFRSHEHGKGMPFSLCHFHSRITTSANDLALYVICQQRAIILMNGQKASATSRSMSYAARFQYMIIFQKIRLYSNTRLWMDFFDCMHDGVLLLLKATLSIC